MVHFEMGYEKNNKDRMVKFYTNVFGWDAEIMGPEMGNYVVVHTTETDKDGMIKNPGNINGGFYEKTTNPLSHPPSVVIAVDDIYESMKKIEALGGGNFGCNGQEWKTIYEA